MGRHRRAAVGVAALALVLAACGDDDGESAARPAVLELSYQEPTGGVDADALEAAITARLDGIGILVEGVDIEDAGEVTVAIEDDRLDELAVDLLEQQGVLRFRPVLSIVPGAPADQPLTPVEQDLADQTVTLAERTGDGEIAATYQLGPALLDGAAIETATVQQDPSGAWGIQVVLAQPALDELNRAAALCFARDAACPTGELAIVVDGTVLTAPSVAQPSFGRDQVVITTPLSEVDVRRLATILQAGPLPVALVSSATG